MESIPHSAESAAPLIAAVPAAALAATLDREWTYAEGEALPELWHWIYSWPTTAQAALGVDGHPAKGGFLPDLGLPRRMWAGSRVRFHTPLEIGQPANRVSRVIGVKEKQGRSGRLGFVTIKHEWSSTHGLAIEEEQDVVYRDVTPAPAQAPGAAAKTEKAVDAAPAARTDEQWSRSIEATPVLLFRYSALTFNGHRIHYDLPYATEVEGYPQLVVHGPLQATLLADMVHRHLPEARMKTFSFMAQRPVFAGRRFTLCARAEGESIDLWIRDHEGALTMTARATLA